MEEQNNHKLFADESGELISLDEELIKWEPVEPEEHLHEKRFGGKNIFFLGFVLTLAALTILFMLGVFDRGEEPEKTESAYSEASQAMAQSTIESENVIEVSSPAESSEETSAGGEESEESVDMNFHGWIINNLGYTYLYHGVGVEQFNYSDATLQKYVSSVQSLATQVPGGISVYCMPIPTRVGFLYNEISADIKREDNFFNSSQQTFLDTVEETVTNGVGFINLYQTFSKEYSAGTELFFKTDLNWTADAAYLAYENFCEQSGNSAISLEAYEERQIEGFLGTFYTATSSEILKENADVLRYYKNANTDACKVTLYSGSSVYKNYSLASNTVLGASSAYSVFLGTSGSHFKIETTNTSGKKLLIVGDGSAAAILPFLIANYSEIHYIDVAYYKDSFAALFDAVEYNDVLFMTYVTNAVKGTYPNHLATMAGVQQDG